MDYLTKFYKNKVENLQEQIKTLENQIKLMEMDITMQSPEKLSAMNDPSKGGQSGKFGGDTKKSAQKKKTETTEVESELEVPLLLQRVPGQPDSGWNKPRTTPMPANQPPHPLDLGYGKKSTKTKSDDYVSKERHAGVQDMVKDALDTAGKKDTFDTSLSLGMGSNKSTSSSKSSSATSGDDILAKAGALLSSMNAKAAGAQSTQPKAPSAKSSSPSAQSAPSAPSAPSAAPSTQTNNSPSSIATTDYGRKPVQATSDPLRSTFKAGGYIDRPDGSSGIGSVQLDPSDLKDEKTKQWAQKQLEAEVGATPTKKPPTEKPRMPGFLENLGKELSFAGDVAANTWSGVGERIKDLVFNDANIISKPEENQVGYGSSMMPKADKTPSRTADWLETQAGNKPGLASDILRDMAKQARARSATERNPNADAAKAKYDQEVADMLKRGTK